MKKIVDIHSHVLPGIDDGACDFEETKQMLKMSYAEGCRHLFLTPHADALKGQTIKTLLKIRMIRKWLANEQMNLKIYQGSEIYVDSEYVENPRKIIKKIKRGVYPTLNDTKYVMIEFNLGGFALEEISPVIEVLVNGGYIPIIAHAERYNVPFEYFCELREMGCLTQMNLNDLYFRWENEISKMTQRLLKEKMFDFVGTDAHNVIRRPPVIREYIDFLYENYDKEYVDSIVYKNAVERLGCSIR